MALTAAQRDALIRRERELRVAVRDRLVEFATSLWGGMGSWRSSDVERFVEVIVPRVRAGQITVARLTDTYLAQMTGAAPVGLVDLDALRGGAPLTDVYTRPATELWGRLAQGQDFPAALAAATTRLASLVATDMQLAGREQARHSLRSSRLVDAYRRVPGGAHPCALCLIASTQRYWKSDLMPIHPGCSCGVEPLGKGEHRAQVIDRRLLEQVHEEVGRVAGRIDLGARDIGLDTDNPLPQYWHLVAVRMHGEYGPTLTWRSHVFTGAGDL